MAPGTNGSGDNLSRARTGYAAFSCGDMTTLAEVLAPDVEWVVGGDNALTGTYDGREAAFEFFGRILSLTGGTFVVALQALAEPEPGMVLALVRVTAEANGRSYDEDALQRLDMADGQVVRCRTFSENTRLFDELVGPRVIALTEPGRATAPTG